MSAYGTQTQCPRCNNVSASCIDGDAGEVCRHCGYNGPECDAVFDRFDKLDDSDLAIVAADCLEAGDIWRPSVSVDERSDGWYWQDDNARSEYAGPFSEERHALLAALVHHGVDDDRLLAMLPAAALAMLAPPMTQERDTDAAAILQLLDNVSAVAHTMMIQLFDRMAIADREPRRKIIQEARDLCDARLRNAPAPRPAPAKPEPNGINLVPTFEASARMLVPLFLMGDQKGKDYAIAELIRLGRIADGAAQLLKSAQAVIADHPDDESEAINSLHAAVAALGEAGKPQR